MLQNLKFLFFSLLTIRHEVKYITDALCAHQVNLPTNYWRFTLIKPFVDLKGNSALVRNFCPLFWVTNLLAVIYISLSPIILVSYIAIKFGKWVKRIFAPILKKYKEEKPKKDIEDLINIKFTWQKVESTFKHNRDANSLYYVYLYPEVEELRSQIPAFKIEDITLDQLKHIIETENLEDNAVAALVFVYQYKAEWRNKFESFVDEARAVHEKQLAEAKAKQKAKESKIQKILPKLVKMAKMSFSVILALACVLVVILLGWTLYHWFIPAMMFIVDLVVSLAVFIVSPSFVQAVLVLLGGVIVMTLVGLLIDFIFSFFEEKIIEKCEEYYAKEEVFLTRRRVKIDNVQKNYRAALFGMWWNKGMSIVEEIFSFIGRFLSWPFVFVKMFYSKNCPAITVVDPDATKND